MKIFSICLFFMLVSSFLWSNDDSTILTNAESSIKKAKTELASWDKTHSSQTLETAISLLNEARDHLQKAEDVESKRYNEINQEIAMLSFWANKSRKVLDIKDSKSDLPPARLEVTIPPTQPTSPTSAQAPVANANTDMAAVIEVKPKEKEKGKEKINTSIRENESPKRPTLVLPEDRPIITSAFIKAADYYKQYPMNLYECEYMFRDICFDYPNSPTALLAKEIADQISAKIIENTKLEEKYRADLISEIGQYQTWNNSKNYAQILTALTTLQLNEKNKQKLAAIETFIEETSYLQLTIDAISDLLTFKKIDPPPASIVGVNFKSYIVKAEKSGLTISTEKDFRAQGMIIPWTKVTSKQLGDLLGTLACKEDVSFKVVMAIYLLGNAQDAFEILYQKHLESPITMAKYSHEFFKILHLYREQKIEIIDQQITKANRLHSNRDTTGAVKLLTSTLLEIQNNLYLRDQLDKIHATLKSYNH